MNSFPQPILILGGFLLTGDAYKTFINRLSINCKYPIEVVDVNKIDWIMTNWKFGWKRILDRVHSDVLRMQKNSPTGKVTLIGHSTGGVMLRLYLSDSQILGKPYKGKSYCNHLITLGSPHKASRSTYLRGKVDELFPGSFYSSEVEYVSIAGALNLESSYASYFSKYFAKISYKSIDNNTDLYGDGLVPLCSSLLNGSKMIVLEDTSHSSLFGKSWYGSLDRSKKICDLILKSISL